MEGLWDFPYPDFYCPLQGKPAGASVVCMVFNVLWYDDEHGDNQILWSNGKKQRLTIHVLSCKIYLQLEFVLQV